MKRWLLAVAVLLGGSVASAWADYVVLIVDPAKKSELNAQQPGQTYPGSVPMGNDIGGPTSTPPGRPGRPMYPGYPQGGGLMMGTPAPAPQPKPPPTTGPIDFDAVPTHAVAVVEIDQKLTEAQYQAFSRGKPLPVTGRFGKAILAPTLGANKEIQVVIVRNLDKSSLRERLLDLEDQAATKGTKDKPERAPAAAVLALADWCLKHGFLDKFTDTMDGFAKNEPKHPAAVAYLKVKADLARPTTAPKPTATRDGLLREYKAVNSAASPHYTAYHKATADEPSEVKSRLRHLDKAFQTFYYWFSLRGTVLPVPTERLPAVVAMREDEFKQLHDQLVGGPILADSFLSRREGVLVLSAKRRDEQYAALEKEANVYWSQGVNRDEVLRNALVAFPKQFQEPYAKASLEAMALVQITMETDAERAGVTHDGSRQLLYASGLLPRGVVAPQWLGFGVGSFFETPPMSPYVSAGGTNSEYLPLWKNLRAEKQFAKSKEHPAFDPAETLRLVVTDGYFRQAQLDGSRLSRRKAEASSWALLYYLAHGNNKLDGPKPTLEGLHRYLKELAKMPRDMELDEDAQLSCFCKAFGLLDANSTGDLSKSPKFQAFAITWATFLDQEQLELKAIVEGIHSVTTKHIAPEGDDADATEYTDAPLTDSFHPMQTTPTGGPSGSGMRPGKPYPMQSTPMPRPGSIPPRPGYPPTAN